MRLLGLLMTVMLSVWVAKSAVGEAAVSDLPPMEEWQILKFTTGYNERGTMVTDHLIRLAREADREATTMRNGIRTREDWETRRKGEVREGLLSILGGLPEKSELNARVHGGFEREMFTVENIVYEQLPGFAVSANLFIPKGRSFPAPAVVAPCGHSGREQEHYQALGMSFASNGYVTLVVDSPDRGERVVHGNDHFKYGALTYLTGANAERYFSLDVMREIDYLLTREEVDGERIACTGVSGGAVSTLHATALDERIRCAIPVCGVIPLSQLIENLYTTCPEQLQQNTLGKKIDEMDIGGLIAPRPMLLMQGQRDELFYLPEFIRGCQQIAHYYELYGARDKIAWETFDAPHSYNAAMRQTALEWMGRWIGDGETTARDPEVIEPASAEEVAARPEITATIFSVNAEIARALGRDLPGAGNVNLNVLRRDAERLLGLSLPNPPARHQPLGAIRGEGIVVEKSVLFPEPDIWVPLWIARPEGEGPFPAAVYLGDEGGSVAMRPGGPVRSLVEAGYLVAVPDVRGIGETAMTPTRWDHHGWCDVHWFAAYSSFVVSKPLIGMRIRDALCVVDAVAERDDVHKAPIQMWGKGQGGVWALYCALLDERVGPVVVERAPWSFLSIACDDDYTWPVELFIPDVLRFHDLPHLSAALNNPILFFSPQNARGEAEDIEIFIKTCQLISRRKLVREQLSETESNTAAVQWLLGLR